MESFYKNLFLIQDLYASGYRMADVGPDENGLVSTLYSFFQLTFKLCSTQFKVKYKLKVFLEAISIRSESLFYGQNWIQYSIWLYLRFWVETWRTFKDLSTLNLKYNTIGKAIKFIHSLKWLSTRNLKYTTYNHGFLVSTISVLGHEFTKLRV